MPEETEELRRNIDAFWRLIVRRRWLLLPTACLIALGSVGVSLVLPDQYVSEATIIVEQQQVPERYVTPTSTSDLSSALQAMEEDVLSHTQLLRIINEFGLYKKEQRRHTPEELVDIMRGKIEIVPLEANPEKRDVNSFRISFTGDTAVTAQQVTSRLTSLFIEQNLQTREQQAIGTTSFLEGQLETARVEFQKQEERLKDFKTENLGELPDQQQGNLTILSGMQMQLQNTQSALARAQQQKAYLSSLLTEYRDMASAGGQLPGGQTQTASPADTLQAELNRLNTARAELLARDLPDHPDVVNVDQEIAQTKASIDRLAKAPAAASSDTAQGSQTPTRGTTADAVIAQTKSQLEANGFEIDDLGKDQKRFEDDIAVYQRRLNLTPVREQQLSGILSDYNSAKQNYEDLLNKKTQSELASSLERQQQGQQFRIVDPPTVPTKPTSPNRVKISLGGVAGGLAGALVLAFLIEFKKSSFYTEGDVKQRYEVPFVLGIPALRSVAEVRRSARWRAFEWTCGSLLLLVVLAAELYIVRLG